MAKRSREQKIGAIGHKFLVSLIEEHDHWLARDLSEDYGIDCEAELTEHGVRGEILKFQIKSQETVDEKDGLVKMVVERRYVDYARSCRYPVILALVDITLKKAWYLWLQHWMLQRRGVEGALDKHQQSWTAWVSTAAQVTIGLDGDLKSIAKWEGETQLTLSLMDALRCAHVTRDAEAIRALSEIIDRNAPNIADASLDAIIDQAIALGDRLRGSEEGNFISAEMFRLLRKYGDRISMATLHDLVMRGESYSRTGLIGLSILYDEFFDRTRSLGLPDYFRTREPRVAYYCALREAYPHAPDPGALLHAPTFVFGDVRYPDDTVDFNKWANRGPAGVVDYLVPVETKSGR